MATPVSVQFDDPTQGHSWGLQWEVGTAVALFHYNPLTARWDPLPPGQLVRGRIEAPGVPRAVLDALGAERTRRAGGIPWPAEFDPAWPLVQSYGLGVDSTAAALLLHRSGIRPDLIVFSDTGGELPTTYAYLDIFNHWCRSVGFPEVTVVRYTPKKHDEYRTLEENVKAKRMLPSAAMGPKFHGCSLKYKVDVINRYVAQWPPARAVWGFEGARRKKGQRAEGRVVRIIGYDDSPADRERRRTFEVKDDGSDDLNAYFYPLQRAHWSRPRCIEEILAEGLPVPPKSACFFCPNQKTWEILNIALRFPDYAWRILEIERIAGPHLRSIAGLWREEVKGTHGGMPRPGTMTEFLLVWMRDGRAYKALPKGDEAVPYEVCELSHVGKAYRRKLTVFQDDPAALAPLPGDVAALELEGRAASERLLRLYEATHGVDVLPKFLAAAAARTQAQRDRANERRKEKARAAKAAKAAKPNRPPLPFYFG